MGFYEIVYETGRVSVASYENDAEAKSAVEAHHNRAKKGEPGGPIGAPAERISKVYKYGDTHPNEYNPSDSLSGEVATKEISEMIKNHTDENGVISLGQLAVGVRGLSHPMHNERKNSHDSFFRMKEQGELKLDLEGAAS